MKNELKIFNRLCTSLDGVADLIRGELLVRGGGVPVCGAQGVDLDELGVLLVLLEWHCIRVSMYV